MLSLNATSPSRGRCGCVRLLYRVLAIPSSSLKSLRWKLCRGVFRRRREGLLPPRTAQAIRLLLHRHVKREYMVVELTAPIIQGAEDLLDKHPLRAYDAIQLASALIANTRLIEAALAPLVFVSADVRLLAAATAKRLIVEDPNAHP